MFIFFSWMQRVTYDFFPPNARSANKCFTYILQCIFYMNLLFPIFAHNGCFSSFSLCGWISAGVSFGECYVFVTLFIQPSLTFSQIHRCCACNKSTPDERRVTHPVCQRMTLWPRLPLHWRCKKGSTEIFALKGFRLQCTESVCQWGG